MALYNSTVIPAATYVTGNLYPNESRPSTLKKCSDLDKTVRKLLVEKGLLGKSNTRNIVYLPQEISGLGLKSIRQETEIQYVRKGLYLKLHPEMVDVRLRYERLARKGWRNPLTDAESILEKYNIALQDKEETESLAIYIKKAAQAIAEQQQQRRRREWESSIHYARVLRAEKSKITFPALKDIALED